MASHTVRTHPDSRYQPTLNVLSPLGSLIDKNLRQSAIRVGPRDKCSYCPGWVTSSLNVLSPSKYSYSGSLTDRRDGTLLEEMDHVTSVGILSGVLLGLHHMTIEGTVQCETNVSLIYLLLLVH